MAELQAPYRSSRASPGSSEREAKNDRPPREGTLCPVERMKGNEMNEPTENAAEIIDEKLQKLIKRTKKQRGLLWPAVVSKLELARADVKAMIKVYASGPK